MTSGSPLLVRELIADTGAATAQAGFELLLQDNDCLVKERTVIAARDWSPSPQRTTVLQPPIGPQYVSRTELEILHCDREICRDPSMLVCPNELHVNGSWLRTSFAQLDPAGVAVLVLSPLADGTTRGLDAEQPPISRWRWIFPGAGKCKFRRLKNIQRKMSIPGHPFD